MDYKLPELNTPQEDADQVAPYEAKRVKITRYFIWALFLIALFRLFISIFWVFAIAGAMIIKHSHGEKDISKCLLLGFVVYLWDISLSISMFIITAYKRILLSNVISWLNLVSFLGHIIFLVCMSVERPSKSNSNDVKYHAVISSVIDIMLSIIVVVIILKVMPNIHSEQDRDV